jgi:hypothetical protein
MMMLADHVARVADAEAEYQAATRAVRSLASVIAAGMEACDIRGAIYYARGNRCSHPLDQARIDDYWRRKRELRIERRMLAEALAQMPAVGEA